MSTISPAAVKALRDRTNAPMMECKAALTECAGDMDKAIDFLRKKNAGIQAKKGDRETAEGRIAVYIDNAKKFGAIIEVRCESAPVAKNEHFVKLSNDLARHVAIKDTASVDALLTEPFIDDDKKTVNDRVGDVVGLIRENMKPARFTRLNGLLGSYVHHDGTVGVLLQVEGDKAEDQLLRDVCMHITAKNPVAARSEDVPAEVIAKEKEIAEEQIAADPKNKNKPANILAMIIEGKIKSYYTENVLVEQPFVKDDTKKVGDVLKAAGLKVVKFVRYRVGEK
ncbi:MAG: translation elongation factor Ts [Gemmataceae bacterium]|nr:translation elongation factor Ts [Gemmataceae bacterium]